VERRQLCADVLRVEPLRSRGRADQIAEDDGHDLPLLHARRSLNQALAHSEQNFAAAANAVVWEGSDTTRVRRIGPFTSRGESR
jgi:hypothetical protein